MDGRVDGTSVRRTRIGRAGEGSHVGLRATLPAPACRPGSGLHGQLGRAASRVRFRSRGRDTTGTRPVYAERAQHDFALTRDRSSYLAAIRTQRAVRVARGCYAVPRMDVSVRELRNHTARVISAVESGEPVVLTVRGRAV